ncbi:MAG: carboxymuconolactone decarboxylase family protein [Alphaproteobacteria bacterium]|nr:MAG: carboxymuconolactone decarboxylase family protein [Alphaproteobacteria bacterium]
MDIQHRLDTPRIAPLPVDQWDPALREQLLGNRPPEMGDGEVFAIFRTLANHPRLAGAFGRWGNQILFKSSLGPRDRELAILRVGWLARAAYEWGHHVAIARDHAGMTDADIELARSGPQTGSDTPDDVLLRAVDELMGDHFISPPTWAALATRYDETQLIDLVFTVGQYAMVSMALNSFGVQLEAGYRG